MAKNRYILFLFLSLCSWSQNLPTFELKSITTADGLSNRSITAITEDSNGQIWIGTADGLNRLDGYRVKKYFYNPKLSKGICNNTVSVFNANLKNQLWMGTASGICYFDAIKNQFVKPDAQNKTPISKEFFPHPLYFQNTFWVFGSHHFYKIKDTSQITTFNYRFNPKTNRGIRRYFDVTIDANNRIWANNATYLLELEPRTMLPKKEIYVGTKPNDGLTKIIPQDQYLWLATWGNGLLRMDARSNQQQEINGLKAPIIHDIVRYKNKYIIAGTNLGYAVINTETLETKEYPLPTEVRCLYVDHHNTLWLGTDLGVLFSKESNQAIRKLTIQTAVNPLSSFQLDDKRLAHSFASTQDHYFGLLEYGNGVLEFDKKWNLLGYHRSIIEDVTKVAYRDINAICEKEGLYWIASNAGLSKCTKQLKQIQLFKPTVVEAKEGGLERFKKIIPFDNDRLMLLSAKSISIFNTRSEQFERTYISTKNKSQVLTDAIITGLSLLDNQCYLTTENGLVELNLKTGIVKEIPLPYSNQRLICLTTANDQLWIGTQTGLICYDVVKKQFQSFYRNDGLCSDTILSLTFSYPNQLWIATSSGLSCMDTQKKTFNNLFQKDGLPDNQIEGGLFLDDNQAIVIGTINHISIISPRLLQGNLNSKKTIINEIKINNQATNWQFENKQKQIVVSHNQNNVSLHFSIAGTFLNDDTTYYYKINTTWYSLNSGFIQLNSLSDGTYLVEVASQPIHSKMNDRIRIVVRPPFYKTMWFIGLCMGLTGMILYFIYRSKTQALLNKKSYEMKVKDAEMKTLRSQMNPHFVFNTLNSINSYII